jgi:hypothetical protein
MRHLPQPLRAEQSIQRAMSARPVQPLDSRILFSTFSDVGHVGYQVPSLQCKLIDRGIGLGGFTEDAGFWGCAGQVNMTYSEHSVRTGCTVKFHHSDAVRLFRLTAPEIEENACFHWSSEAVRVDRASGTT